MLSLPPVSAPSPRPTPRYDYNPQQTGGTARGDADEASEYPEEPLSEYGGGGAVVWFACMRVDVCVRLVWLLGCDVCRCFCGGGITRFALAGCLGTLHCACLQRARRRRLPPRAEPPHPPLQPCPHPALQAAARARPATTTATSRRAARQSFTTLSPRRRTRSPYLSARAWRWCTKSAAGCRSSRPMGRAGWCPRRTSAFMMMKAATPAPTTRGALAGAAARRGRGDGVAAMGWAGGRAALLRKRLHRGRAEPRSLAAARGRPGDPLSRPLPALP